MSELRTFSFRRGYNQLTADEARTLRVEIINALDLTRNGFYRRLRGEVEPKITEAEKIESLFRSYNISDIWGDQ